MATLLRTIYPLLLLGTAILWTVPVAGKDPQILQVISVVGGFLDSHGRPVEEFECLEPDQHYRLLSDAHIQIASPDGKNLYDAVGPGQLLLDANGTLHLNGKRLKPKDLRSLLEGVSTTDTSGSELAGLTLRGIRVVPDQEKRSFIRVVDGYASLGKNMMPAQAREAAFADAREKALQIAKAHIESNKLVKNGRLEYALTRAGSEGVVFTLNQEDLGLENNRYHVRIKAEVEYVLILPGKSPEPTRIMSPAAPLTVKIWTPHKLYRQGEIVKVFVLGNRDFHARIMNIDSKGNITQLLPNDRRDINLFKGGHVYEIPGSGDRFTIKVRAPYGEEQIVVYASDIRLGRVDTESVGQGLRYYKGSRSRLGVQTRALFVEDQPVGSHAGADFYEATWKLKTLQW
jgi:hypothetical protein